MKDVTFVADFFLSAMNRGAEQNDHTVIRLLNDKGLRVKYAMCDRLRFIKKNEFYIISNFAQLGPDAIAQLVTHRNYVIYEHDFKFAPGRNPSQFLNHLLHADAVQHRAFYEAAQAVILLTTGQEEIFRKNLPYLNYTVTGLSPYEKKDLDQIRSINVDTFRESNTGAVLDFPHFQKGTSQSLTRCNELGITPVMLSSRPTKIEFLQDLAVGERLVFHPQIYESCSRLSMEARMLNMEVDHNGMIGAATEPWWEQSGHDLIDLIEDMQSDVIWTAFKDYVS